MGLAYDPTTDTLFGVDSYYQVLITIDRNTGAGAAVGTPGFGKVHGSAYASATNTLFGIDTQNEKLITIDLAESIIRVPPSGTGDLVYVGWASPSPEHKASVQQPDGFRFFNSNSFLPNS